MYREFVTTFTTGVISYGRNGRATATGVMIVMRDWEGEGIFDLIPLRAGGRIQANTGIFGISAGDFRFFLDACQEAVDLLGNAAFASGEFVMDSHGGEA